MLFFILYLHGFDKLLATFSMLTVVNLMEIFVYIFVNPSYIHHLSMFSLCNGNLALLHLTTHCSLYFDE